MVSPLCNCVVSKPRPQALCPSCEKLLHVTFDAWYSVNFYVGGQRSPVNCNCLTRMEGGPRENAVVTILIHHDVVNSTVLWPE